MENKRAKPMKELPKRFHVEVSSAEQLAKLIHLSKGIIDFSYISCELITYLYSTDIFIEEAKMTAFDSAGTSIKYLTLVRYLIRERKKHGK